MSVQYNIGEAGKLSGLSTKTIRYYESIDLIKASNRKENNYRTYSEHDIQKLRMITEAKSLGLSLDEIKHILSACFDNGCMHLKEYLQGRLPEYIKQTELQIKSLEKLKIQFKTIQNQLNEFSEDDCSNCENSNECYKYLKVNERR